MRGVRRCSRLNIGPGLLQNSDSALSPHNLAQGAIVPLHMRGVVVKFDAERGFGFIRSEGRSDVFVHLSEVKGDRELSVGQQVDFSLQTTRKGDRAVDVRPGRVRRPPKIKKTKKTKKPSPKRSLKARFLWMAAAITSIVGLGAWAVFELPLLWCYLLGINASTFFLYAYDKGASVSAQLRVPERVLHLLGFLGGTPAAFLGQQVLRHKTRKSSFQLWFVTSAALQVGLYLAYRALSSGIELEGYGRGSSVAALHGVTSES